MVNAYEEFLSEYGVHGKFQARARYSRAIDAIEYLNEDCAYTSERVDGWLTVFWHPRDKRLVGLRVKGIRHIFLTSNGSSSFHSLVNILELVVRAWGEEKLTDSVPSYFDRMSLYLQAKELAEAVTIEHEEIERIRQVAA